MAAQVVLSKGRLVMQEPKDSGRSPVFCLVGAFPITKSQPEITSAAKLGPSTAPPRGSWVGGVSPEGSFLKPLLSAPSVAILARYASTCHKTLRWTLHSMYIICLMDGASQLSVLLVLPWRWPSCCWLCLAAASVCVSVCLCVSVRRVLRSPAYLERFPLWFATVEEALRNWTSERVSELHFFAEGAIHEKSSSDGTELPNWTSEVLRN